MDDPSRPGWSNQPQGAASRTETLQIERGAPQFWRELQDKLEAAVDALYLQDLSGMITSYGGGIRVTLNRPGKAFQQVYTDVVFKRSPVEIRCSTLTDGSYNLRFCLLAENKVAVTSTRRDQMMNAEQACEHIMTLLVKASER